MHMHEQTFTKVEVGDMLDKLATAYATTNHVAIHKAYDAVLSTDEGALLYARSRNVVVEKAAPELSKAAAIGEAIEALAKQYAAANHTTAARAMVALIQTDAGRALYAGMRHA